MLRTSRLSVVGLVLLALGSPLSGEREPRFEPLPELESGIATVEIGNRTILLQYSRTVAGPLFALQPLVAQLGGTLEIGPLRQKHELEVTGTSFLFGPGAPALTSGEEIEELSQPPGTGPES